MISNMDRVLNVKIQFKNCKLNNVCYEQLRWFLVSNLWYVLIKYVTDNSKNKSRKKTKKNGHKKSRKSKRVWREITTVLLCSWLTNLWQIVNHQCFIFKRYWRRLRVAWTPGKIHVRASYLFFFVSFNFLLLNFPFIQFWKVVNWLLRN